MCVKVSLIRGETPLIGETLRKGLYSSGALRRNSAPLGRAPPQGGWSLSLSKCSVIKMGEARFYGAREGKALPLKYYFTFYFSLGRINI